VIRRATEFFARGARFALSWKEALSMTVQHADLFHCLACGRVAYEAHGGPAPDCCGQPMVRAVADVVQEVPPTRPADSGSRAEVEEHALFAELVELAQWCHSLRDVDISRTEELASRLSVLHQALIDQTEDAQLSGAGAHSALAEPAPQITAERSHGPAEQLLSAFARFVAQLRNKPSPFASWGLICDRLDEVVAEFRQYARAEGELSRLSSARRGSSAP
jgi:hypothetical protein